MSLLETRTISVTDWTGRRDAFKSGSLIMLFVMSEKAGSNPRCCCPALDEDSRVIVDLSKFGSGTVNSDAGGGGAGDGGDGKVSFVFMSCSRLMTGLNVVMALSVSSIRLSSRAELAGVVSSLDRKDMSDAWLVTFLL